MPYLHYISESDAQALAEVYRNNAPSFTNATSVDTQSENRLNRSDVAVLFKSISQSETAKQNAKLTTQVKFERLVRSYPNGASSGMSSAGNIASTFSESVAQTEIQQGEDKDKQNEREAQIYSSIIGGFGNTPTGLLHLPDPFAIVIATTTNLAANAVSNQMKTDNAGQAKQKANTDFDAQIMQTKAVVLSAYEADAYEIDSGQKPASKEQKEKARQFIQAVKDFNNELPPDRKILGTNGRLIAPSTASLNQLNSMQFAKDGTTNSNFLDESKAKKAALVIKKQTTAGWLELGNSVKDGTGRK